MVYAGIERLRGAGVPGDMIRYDAFLDSRRCQPTEAAGPARAP